MTARRLAGREDAGALAPTVAVFGLMLFVLAGLVLDGGRLLNARARATSYAEEAARTGAGQIDVTKFSPWVDVGPATARVQRYCAIIEAEESSIERCGPAQASDIDGNGVRIEVRISIPAGLLGLVGIGDLHTTGTGKAVPVDGVRQPQDYLR